MDFLWRSGQSGPGTASVNPRLARKAATSASGRGPSRKLSTWSAQPGAAIQGAVASERPMMMNLADVGRAGRNSVRSQRCRT